MLEIQLRRQRGRNDTSTSLPPIFGSWAVRVADTGAIGRSFCRLVFRRLPTSFMRC